MLGSYARQGHLAPVPSVFQGRPVDPMSEMGSSVRDRIPSIGAQQSTLGQYSFSNAKAMTQFKVFLRVLTAEHEEHPIRTLQLPVNIGRAFDMRVRPSPMNGLFNSSYLSRNHAIIKIEAGKVRICIFNSNIFHS